MKWMPICLLFIKTITIILITESKQSITSSCYTLGSVPPLAIWIASSSSCWVLSPPWPWGSRGRRSPCSTHSFIHCCCSAHTLWWQPSREPHRNLLPSAICGPGPSGNVLDPVYCRSHPPPCIRAPSPRLGWPGLIEGWYLSAVEKVGSILNADS